jgi:hypothetical protein
VGPWRPDGNGLLHVKSKDRTLVYELRPSAHPNALIRTNTSGFRDREFTTPKPDGVYRIIAVGQTTVWNGRLPSLPVIYRGQ